MEAIETWSVRLIVDNSIVSTLVLWSRCCSLSESSGSETLFTAIELSIDSFESRAGGTRSVSTTGSATLGSNGSEIPFLDEDVVSLSLLSDLESVVCLSVRLWSLVVPFDGWFDLATISDCGKFSDGSLLLEFFEFFPDSDDDFFLFLAIGAGFYKQFVVNHRS